jgi:hypothetical protein
MGQNMRNRTSDSPRSLIKANGLQTHEQRLYQSAPLGAYEAGAEHEESNKKDGRHKNQTGNINMPQTNLGDGAQTTLPRVNSVKIRASTHRNPVTYITYLGDDQSPSYSFV